MSRTLLAKLRGMLKILSFKRSGNRHLSSGKIDSVFPLNTECNDNSDRGTFHYRVFPDLADLKVAFYMDTPPFLSTL